MRIEIPNRTDLDNTNKIELNQDTRYFKASGLVIDSNDKSVEIIAGLQKRNHIIVDKNMFDKTPQKGDSIALYITNGNAKTFPFAYQGDLKEKTKDDLVIETKSGIQYEIPKKMLTKKELDSLEVDKGVALEIKNLKATILDLNKLKKAIEKNKNELSTKVNKKFWGKVTYIEKDKENKNNDTIHLQLANGNISKHNRNDLEGKIIAGATMAISYDEKGKGLTKITSLLGKVTAKNKDQITVQLDKEGKNTLSFKAQSDVKKGDQIRFTLHPKENRVYPVEKNKSNTVSKNKDLTKNKSITR